MVGQAPLFNVQRGVRQGCPLSPYLFVLSVEMLAKEIRKNRNINGILVNDEEIKGISNGLYPNSQ